MPVMTKTLVVILLIGLGSPALSAQQPDASTAVAIRALEHAWVDGQSSNDNRALDLIFDNALIYVEYGRLVTKGEYLSRIKHEAPEIALEPMSVRVLGDTAIVVGSYREAQAKPSPRQTLAFCRHLGIREKWLGAGGRRRRPDE